MILQVWQPTLKRVDRTSLQPIQNRTSEEETTTRNPHLKSRDVKLLAGGEVSTDPVRLLFVREGVRFIGGGLGIQPRAVEHW